MILAVTLWESLLPWPLWIPVSAWGPVSGRSGSGKGPGEGICQEAGGGHRGFYFLHSGITGLLDVVYNQGTFTTIILDNSTTAMTGHQDHPGTGKTAGGEAAPAVDLVRLVQSWALKGYRWWILMTWQQWKGY